MPSTHHGSDSDIAGPDDAPTIVFLHGVSYTRKAWLPQMRALSDAFRVIALDLPGHGALADVPFDFDAAVDGVADTIEQYSDRPVLLVGISLGGCIAMELARRLPKIVAGLVACSATFDPTSLLCRLVLFGESVTFPRMQRQLTKHFQDYVRQTMDPETADAMLAAGSYWPTASTCVRQLMGRDFLGAVRSFDGPILFINGSRDFVHRYFERTFASSAKNAQVVVLDGANHICNLDKPTEFTNAVRRFASDTVWPSPGAMPLALERHAV